MRNKRFKFQPLHSNVLVLPDQKKTKTENGIIIPDTAENIVTTGKVMAAGPGSVGKPVQVKAGDLVKYGAFTGQEIEYEGTMYLLIDEGAILGIV